MTCLHLLRHGTVVGAKRLLGSTDLPLSEAGLEDMFIAANTVKTSVIVSSPLQRCARFSETLAARINIDVEIEEGLKEVHFGDWDGAALEQLWTDHPKALSAYFASPFTATPPGGEDTLAFHRRVINAVESIRARHPKDSVLVVAHGGVIKCILAHCLQLDYKTSNWFTRLQIDYASLSAVSFWDDDPADQQATVHYTNRRVSTV